MRTRQCSAPGVLGDVRERLDHDEVGGRLGGGGQAVVDLDVERHLDRVARRDRGQRGPEPAVGEDRGVDAAREVAQLGRARAWPPRAPRRRALRAATGSLSSFSWAMPRSIASATSRAWAPSWRSRSIRCSSAAWESTAPARVRSSSTTRRRSLGPSSARPSSASPIPAPRVSGTARVRTTRPTGMPIQASSSVSTLSAPRSTPGSPIGRVPRGQREQPEARAPRADRDDEAREPEHRQQDHQPQQVLPGRRVADRGVQPAEHPAPVRRAGSPTGPARRARARRAGARSAPASARPRASRRGSARRPTRSRGRARSRSP